MKHHVQPLRRIDPEQELRAVIADLAHHAQRLQLSLEGAPHDSETDLRQDLQAMKHLLWAATGFSIVWHSNLTETHTTRFRDTLTGIIGDVAMLERSLGDGLGQTLIERCLQIARACRDAADLLDEQDVSRAGERHGISAPRPGEAPGWQGAAALTGTTVRRR